MFSKHIMCLAISIILLVFIEDARSSQIAVECHNESCSTCYTSLVKELLKDDRNYLTLQKIFFPPISDTPVFLEVVYEYGSSTENTKTFFWSSAVYFFFHPVRIFQFTSLLFSDPSLRYDTIELHLPGQCVEADNDAMMLLTQRVSYYNYNM